jgi:putative molybdopterin biosynthesis protein
LKNTPVEEAQRLYFTALQPLIAPRKEIMRVEDALGRTTTKAVYANLSSPFYNAAAMDGVRVVSAKTEGASETRPLRLAKGADWLPVDTGDPVGGLFDAVIMAEDVVETAPDEIELLRAASPWQHVRPVGEDFAAGEMILPGGHCIRAIDIGALLAGGVTEVSVTGRPRVAVVPTGSELVDPASLPVGEAPAPGRIIDSNSRMLAALVSEAGGEPSRLPITKDDYETLKQVIAGALASHDLVLINAGASAGTEDYTVHILRELGEVLVHGVATKPGKPVILAICGGKPVIGLPGYPLAAYYNFENFVQPVLALFTLNPPKKTEKVKATLTGRLVSSLKHREYIRVKVGLVGQRLIAAPLSRGAGALSSLVRADGYLMIEQNSEGMEAASEVEVNLYRPLAEVGSTVVAVGSHDLILDVLADRLPLQSPGNYLSSTHVGSMAGLLALQRGEAHIAPIHLLDPAAGVYNLPVLQEMFPENMPALIKGVERIQGIIVPAGNPLGITRIEDLPGRRFINRQRGAGTRVLLDYLLSEKGIDSSAIIGYEREAATHMAVAAAVAGDSADCGIGVLSAARAMGLDFIPIGPEEYDFAVPREYLNLPHIAAFIAALKDPGFHEKLKEMGGYGCARAGEIVYGTP